MEPIRVAEQIEKKIALLEQGRAKIKEAAEQKALKIAQYDCQLAVTLMKLRAGKPMELQGETIQEPPVTIMEKIAKGICWQERQDMELADIMYKSIIEKLHCIQAELNAWQSINKYLDIISKNT